LEWNKETTSLPKILKNKIVLEMGVGTGKTLAAILKQKPSKIYAIDFSNQAIKILKERFNDKAILKEADAKSVPYPNDYFDVVIAYYIFNNSLKKDRIKIINEVYRVLKKDGICLFEDFSIGDFRNTGQKKGNNLISHFFEKEEIKELFHKFSSIKLKKEVFYPIKYKSNLRREIINVIAKK